MSAGPDPRYELACCLWLEKDNLLHQAMERLLQDRPGVLTHGDVNALRRASDELVELAQALIAALFCGSSRPFEEYLGWRRRVARARRLDLDPLRETLRDLGEVVNGRLAGRDRQAVQAVLEAGARALSAVDPEPAAGPAMGLRAVPECPALVAALLRGDRRAAQNLLVEQLERGRPWIEAAVSLVQPALYEIGRQWQIDHISVAQEHLATALCQDLLARTVNRPDIRPARERRAVIACVEGNFHSLGARLVADGFELAGWRVDYLGADTPSADLLAALSRDPAELLGLSVALPWQIPTARQVIERVKTELGPERPLVLLGGLAMNGIGRAYRRLGADGWRPDAVSASRARWPS